MSRLCWLCFVFLCVAVAGVFTVGVGCLIWSLPVSLPVKVAVALVVLVFIVVAFSGDRTTSYKGMLDP